MRLPELSVERIEPIIYEPGVHIREMDLTFDSDQSALVTFPAVTHPITVVGKRVTFDTKSMILGQWYEFQKNGRNYLAVMKTSDVIDIYQIRE
jgi:hypothetical protein